MTSKEAKVGYSWTAEYIQIELALKARWRPFNDLLEEVRNFKPLSADELRPKISETMREANPQIPVEHLNAVVEATLPSYLPDGVQFSQRFFRPLSIEFVTVALLSHALCEAVINAILALGLAHVGSQDLFAVVERADMKKKWTVVPKCLQPTYELPRDSALYEALDQLTKQRNAMTHYKIEIHREGQKLLDGTAAIKPNTFNDIVRWLYRFFSLPYDLSEYAALRLPQEALPGGPILFRRQPIDPYLPHLAQWKPATGNPTAGAA